MIQQVSSSQYKSYQSEQAKTKVSQSTVSMVYPNPEVAKLDTLEIGNKQDTSVTYKNVSNNKLSSDQVKSLQEEANKATESLRNLVKELILKQNKNFDTSSDFLSGELGVPQESIAVAQDAISDDGDFGIGAVSDRLVNFAIAVSGGDKSKLAELTAAIDKGFSAAKKALGGELPDISQKTYDATMEKLNAWAKNTEES